MSESVFREPDVHFCCVCQLISHFAPFLQFNRKFLYKNGFLKIRSITRRSGKISEGKEILESFELKFDKKTCFKVCSLPVGIR